MQDPPAVHLDHGRAVGEGIGVERLNDGQLVHVGREMRQHVAAPQTRLATLTERPLGTEQGSGLHVAAALFERCGLTVATVQLRLVVEEVHLRGPSVHEEKNAGLGLRRKVGRFHSHRIRRHAGCHVGPRKETIGLEQSGQCQTGETRTELRQEITPGGILQ